jgi:guanylate kinase
MITEKVLILGKSGAGKDYMMSNLSVRGLRPALRQTTRPIRTNEVDGREYDFISKSEFSKMVENDEFLTYQSYNVKNNETWFYGLSKSEYEKSDIVIITPKELNEILEKVDRKKCFVVYLDIDRKIREDRLLTREDKNDSIKRRFDQDDIDFNVDIDFDLRITDPDYDAEDVYDLLIC